MSAIRHRANLFSIRALTAAAVLGLALVRHATAAQGAALEAVANGIPFLVDIQHAGMSGRLFLVSQPGGILILDATTVSSTPFLARSGVDRCRPDPADVHRCHVP